MMYKPTEEFIKMLKNNADFKVACENKQQTETLFEVLDEYGYEWSDGTDLTDRFRFVDTPHNYHIIKSYKCITYGEYDVNYARTFNSLFTTDDTEEINHPSRYKSGKYECIDVMQDVFGNEAVKDFCILNAFKYLWRYQHKGGFEDVSKAAWYCNKAVEIMGGAENES